MSILAIAERTAAGWHPLAREVLAAAQQIGARLAKPVRAAVIGREATAAAAGLTGARLDGIFAVEHERLGVYTSDGYTIALEALLKDLAPELVLFPHTYQTRDYAPRLAARFGQVLVGDAIGYRLDGENLIWVRRIFQGKLLADVRLRGSPPWFVSLQAGAARAEDLISGSTQVEAFHPEIPVEAIRTFPGEPFRDAVDLSAARAIVAAGRGVQRKEDLALFRELAELLGAELAASRPICDNGWLPMDRQVGSSGQTVAPELYIAVGISGAIQHLVGLRGSKTIVASNKDPEAPIFEVADYGLAGDLYRIVPALIAEIRKLKS